MAKNRKTIQRGRKKMKTIKISEAHGDNFDYFHTEEQLIHFLNNCQDLTGLIFEIHKEEKKKNEKLPNV